MALAEKSARAILISTLTHAEVDVMRTGSNFGRHPDITPEWRTPGAIKPAMIVG